jgi:hypothetical protein
VTDTWFFNTDDGEAEGKGAYVKMLDTPCIALWKFKGKRDPEKELAKPLAGERVFYYLNDVGFIATALFTNEPPIPDSQVFRENTPEAFSRHVSDIVFVRNEDAITSSEVKAMGGKLQYIGPLYKMSDQRIAAEILRELQSRARSRP